MGLLSLAAKSIKELVDLGYPESVAKKIADGTLPMDQESRFLRAQEMGMFNNPVLYRGHARDYPPDGRDDMWASVDPDVADTYALGGEYYDEATDSYKRRPGQVTALRTNANNLFDFDAEGQHFDDIYWDDINGLSMDTFPGDVTNGSDSVAELVKHHGEHQGALFRNMLDDFEVGEGSEPTDVYNLLGSRGDFQIRDADRAAFDPEYKGGNILGGVGAAGTAGLLAMGQSEEADAMPSLVLKQGADYLLAARQLRNQINKLGAKGISPDRAVGDYIHNNTTYNDFIRGASRWDGQRNGEAYNTGVNTMADGLVEATDDPRVVDAVEGWRASRLDATRHDPYRAQGIVRAVGAPTADSGLLQAQLHNHDLAVNEHMKNIGVDPQEDPMYDYGSILPFRTNIVTGETEMAMPTFARDMLRGIFDVAESRDSNVYKPDSLLEVL